MQLLEHVRLRDPKKKIWGLSVSAFRGERQRVVIAIAIANKPDLLIADEPTTALDVTVQAQILDILKDLQSRFNMALLIISHDLTVVEKVADRVLVMRHGEVIEEGKNPICFFSKPEKHLYPNTY
ncbi:MAG: ATP-binding cassette domain-containing protein [Holosporaceae bacterium]|nr:MAG: ATP-binding cassette domain-containing protein [Holosporaceae bacterium]